MSTPPINADKADGILKVDAEDMEDVVLATGEKNKKKTMSRFSAKADNG